MPLPVRTAEDHAAAHALKTAIVHVSPAEKQTPEPRDALIEGNAVPREHWPLAARAMLLVTLGGASWLAFAATAHAVRRVIA